MNVLIHNLEHQGVSIVFQYRRCQAQLFEETIEINLRQKYHRVRTKDNHGWTNETYIKTNKLEFQTGYTGRKNWLDTEKTKIEERIPNIVGYIFKYLTEWHECALRNKLLKEEREKELKAQKELEALKKIEEEKFEKLLRDIKNWHLAKDIREYITLKYEDEKLNVIDDAWATWALNKANEIDPLK